MTKEAVVDILQTGPGNSAQDAGRHGLRHLGIGSSGALDRRALRFGNTLLGNDELAAAIEIATPPLVCKVSTTVTALIAGDEVDACIITPEREPVPVRSGWAFQLNAGERLELRGCINRGIAYLLFSGKLSSTMFAGSASMHSQFQLDVGLDTQLHQGQQIKILGGDPIPPRDLPGLKLKPVDNNVRVVTFPEHWQLTEESQQRFRGNNWRVSKSRSRMGVRLTASAPLDTTSTSAIKSRATYPGMIQLPCDGQPIVLLADAQTTGGYKVIGSVIAADLWKLIQHPVDETLRLCPVTSEQALEADNILDNQIKQLATALHQRQNSDQQR